MKHPDEPSGSMVVITYWSQIHHEWYTVRGKIHGMVTRKYLRSLPGYYAIRIEQLLFWLCVLILYVKVWIQQTTVSGTRVVTLRENLLNTVPSVPTRWVSLFVVGPVRTPYTLRSLSVFLHQFPFCVPSLRPWRLQIRCTTKSDKPLAISYPSNSHRLDTYKNIRC